MRKKLNILGLFFGGLIMLGVFYVLFFGSIFSIIKAIELLNIEEGLKKAAFAFFYYIVIRGVYFLSNSLIKNELIVKDNVNFKGELIRGTNLDINIKRVRIVYNIFVIVCLTFLIFGFSMYLHFDFVFVFFLILPVALYGINKGIDEASGMTNEEKQKYIHEQKEYVSNRHDI